MTTPLRAGILLSGGGRTMLNLADRIDDGVLPMTIATVICSTDRAAGIERARGRGLDVHVVGPASDEPSDPIHDAIDTRLTSAGVELVCLAGYVRWFRVADRWVNRVMNIHPALLPEHGGRGMYGAGVHRAVLDSGARESGCTVHFVDKRYDHGPIILQRRCPVLADDDPETLAARVFDEECCAYPEAISLFAAGRLVVDDGCVAVLPA